MKCQYCKNKSYRNNTKYDKRLVCKVDGKLIDVRNLNCEKDVLQHKKLIT